MNNPIPKHIAIIMDGNGRWAKLQGFKTRIRGHEIGVTALRNTATHASEMGIKYLTVYAFSEENWSRPKSEIDALMSILVRSLSSELETLQQNGIRLNAIGNLDNLPRNCKKELQETIKATSSNNTMTLTLALSYGSRQEILMATKNIAKQVLEGTLKINQINDISFSKELSTYGLPDPELMIRTSGEQRISNFLLWQSSYAELVFLPVLWPDFSRVHLEDAISQYQNRERRMGKTSDQIEINE
jgi:undecaprenyl diphosphate synthase